MTLSRYISLTMVFVVGLVRTAFADPAAPPKSGKYWMYIGTFTSPTGSQGIYRCELDVKSGMLTQPVLAVELANPTFLAISPNGMFLYAVGATADAGPKKNEGTIHAFGGLTRKLEC